MCFRALKGRLINYHKIWIRGDIKHKHQTLNTWGYVTVGKVQRIRRRNRLHRLASPDILSMIFKTAHMPWVLDTDEPPKLVFLGSTPRQGA